MDEARRLLKRCGCTSYMSILIGLGGLSSDSRQSRSQARKS